ncbi:MAG TPA: hypothetical protein VGD45_13080 [Steroidobacter sp.]|uniref:hypothetical protein n=1 Tax=Steroidobacter sp. TaxID=1978227 RepID=UPI002ED88295
MFVMLLAALLSACGSDGSEPAQRAPNDLGLQQCELVDGTVLGAPTDPIMIDGVATQACRISAGHIRGGSRVDLKWSHQYKPLAWVLDGKLEIGESKTYATLDEFVKGGFARLGVGAGVLRATAGSTIVVHRNGYFEGDVVSSDENLEGGGEWAGMVVNGIGSHPDCPASTSASAFCNISGPHGYYGGLSVADARTHVIGGTILPPNNAGSTRLGFEGSVSEAGGAVAGAAPLGAAILFNAPQSQSNPRLINVFDSAGSGFEINGGYVANLRLIAQNTRGSAVHWHHGFSGGLTGIFYKNQSEHAAFRGDGGDVDLNGVTLIDRDFTGGTAISVRGGRVDLTNVLVQNFRGCLQLDAGAGATLTGVAFGCLTPTVAADDGTDYAATVTAAALANSDSSYYESDPALTADLRVGNTELSYTAWANSPGGRNIVGNIQDHAGHDLRLTYPDCMGVGTLLPEDQTVVVGRTTYRICQLSGTIEASGRLYSSFNGGSFAWVLNGAVSLGADFAQLGAAEQLASLTSPGYLFVPAGTVVYGRAGASLTVQPNTQWFVDGNANDPVEITALPGNAATRWGGVRILGVDRAECQNGSTAGVCAYAAARQLSIEYLRLMQAGDGQPALQLYEVGSGASIDYLEVVNSASTALALHGGRADLEHVVLSNSAGDQLLWEQGYRGTIRYGLFTTRNGNGGQALHGRNDSVNHDASPRSRPTLANVTLIGEGSGTAIRLEQGSGLLLQNSIAVDFEFCLDIDDAATAALQSSTPQEIAMTHVVLSCAAALVLEAEDGGSDYGHLVASSSSVHQMDPQLDEHFVASNPALPAPGAGYWGAVGGANDGWYLGWSGLGVLLSPECDGKGTLLDDYRYRFSSGQPFLGYGSGLFVELNYKVCRLPSTVSADLELTRYTGTDALINADGFAEVTESGTRYGIVGDVTWTRVPVPTIWLLDSMVTVGNGAELATVEEATALKSNPVELTLQPGTWVMATEEGGLHVTRGGRLQVNGEVMLEDQYCEYQLIGIACLEFPTAGPVSIFGEIDGVALPYIDITYSSDGSIDVNAGNVFGGYAPYAPLGTNMYDFFNGEHYRQFASSWRGITVDGFARNNRCEEAATAEPNSRVCNISGELGYHGGYDDNYANLEINNLYMIGGELQLNSVAGQIEGLNYWPSQFTDEQVGEAAVIELDGGVVNLREVLIDLTGIEGSRKPGTLIGWNHGYQGSMQYIYGASAQVADGAQSVLQANGRDYFIPLLRGANGDTGHENDLPRSMPTIANLSLRSYETDAGGQMTGAVDSSLIELTRGSGLYLYHSVIGATEGDSRISDYCFKLDDGAAERLTAGELVVNHLATTCQTLSDNSAVELGAMPGVNNTYAGSMAVFAMASERNYVDDFGPDAMAVNHEYNRYYPVQQAVDEYGHVAPDFSASPTADTEFLQVSDYLGAVDYWIRPW